MHLLVLQHVKILIKPLKYTSDVIIIYYYFSFIFVVINLNLKCGNKLRVDRSSDGKISYNTTKG